MNNSNNWLVPTLLVVALVYGCQQKSQREKLEEAQAMARDAYAEAEAAKSQVADLESRVSDLEQRLGM